MCENVILRGENVIPRGENVIPCGENVIPCAHSIYKYTTISIAIWLLDDRSYSSVCSLNILRNSREKLICLKIK